MNKKLLPGNVETFIDKCASAVGRSTETEFHVDLWHECIEMKSPIEQIFYCAFETACNLQSIEKSDSDVDEQGPFAYGMFISPQSKIGKYRVDFEIQYSNYRDSKNRKPHKRVIVELDGHNFHDKDEHQRRYEKKRDRFFQKEGFSVFHYTGSEIVNNPFASAVEVVSFLTGLEQEMILDSVNEYFR